MKSNSSFMNSLLSVKRVDQFTNSVVVGHNIPSSNVQNSLRIRLEASWYFFICQDDIHAIFRNFILIVFSPRIKFSIESPLQEQSNYRWDWVGFVRPRLSVVKSSFGLSEVCNFTRICKPIFNQPIILPACCQQKLLPADAFREHREPWSTSPLSRHTALHGTGSLLKEKAFMQRKTQGQNP